MQVEVNDEGDVGGGYQGQENLILNDYANLTTLCIKTYLSFIILILKLILCLPICFPISETGLTFL